MQSKIFELKSPFTLSGDQPKACQEITKSFRKGQSNHTLLGVTGSGKTFTMANVISQLNLSSLVIAPNKTLAAQLYTELKNLFPNNSVGYFISYYDYYQPEAYIPNTDTYISKDSSINDDIDKMRHESTRMLFESKKVIVVASVSCIYGLGSPENYAKKIIKIEKEQKISRNDFIKQLIEIQYFRSDHDFKRGSFRIRGDSIDIFPSHNNDESIRLEFWQNKIESLLLVDALTSKTKKELLTVTLYPNSHYVTEEKSLKSIISEIQKDLQLRLAELKKLGNLLAYQKLEQRVMEDIESFEQLGFCPGIENYSRYLNGRNPGEAPPCLLDYFPDDFLTIIDESHITIPQIGAMYHGDQSRKRNLVDFGFRLPSAMDNRPLNFQEFLNRSKKMLFVSATPGPFELERCLFKYTEQIIRPTGLLDPKIIIKTSQNQIDDLYGEVLETIKEKGRILITTLTKKMAEELTDYYKKMNIKVTYLHSGVESLKRMDILNKLRRGTYDVLIGINLLREGLDLPEVKLVAVMDADKEGFLRSRTSLIQIVGRAARNSESKVIFYADKTTAAMAETIRETNRRRKIQEAYNKEHKIIPTTVIKALPKDLIALHGFLGENENQNEQTKQEKMNLLINKYSIKKVKDLEKLIRKKQKEMKKSAQSLDFEKAVVLRDEIKELKALEIVLGDEI